MAKEKKRKKKKTINDPAFLVNLIVGIGDVSDMTGVSQRQLRYWQEKGMIGMLNEQTNTTRKFDYYAIKKVLLIKELTEAGLTLDDASALADSQLKSIRKTIGKMRLKLDSKNEQTSQDEKNQEETANEF